MRKNNKDFDQYDDFDVWDYDDFDDLPKIKRVGGFKKLMSKIGVALLVILIIGGGVSIAISTMDTGNNFPSNPPPQAPASSFAHLNGMWHVQHMDWWLTGIGMLDFGTIELVDGQSTASLVNDDLQHEGISLSQMRGFESKMQIIVWGGNMNFIEFHPETGEVMNGVFTLFYHEESGEIRVTNSQNWTGDTNSQVLILTRVLE